MTHLLTVEQIARVCHAANRGLQEVLGQPVAPPWDEVDVVVQEGYKHGVRVIQEGNGPEELHRQWTMSREATGWTHGDTIDPANRKHPNLVAYEELPDEAKVKDHMFAAIVTLYSRPLPEE